MVYNYWWDIINRPNATNVYTAEKKQKVDNFIMLVCVQGSPFHMRAGSLGVTR